MELGFGPEFDSYRDEVREFLAAPGHRRTES